MSDTALQSPQPQSQLSKPETFAPRTVSEAMEFAKMIIDSGLAPKAYAASNPAKIVVAMQYGMEVGLQPLQSLQSIAVINGSPGLWGGAELGLVMSSPVFDWIKEDDFETIKKQGYARCTVKRKGMPDPVSRTFSLDDAKTAGLAGKDGTWKTYQPRMLQMRARGFALDDAFPDVLKGLKPAEVLMDYPGPTIDATPVQQAQPQAPADPVIREDQAIAWFKTYKKSGWKSEDARAWLKETIKVESSKDIPVSRYDEAMKWAETPNPAAEPQPAK